MPSFLIESYKVRLELQRVGNPVVTHRNRIIEVVSVPLYHGIVERAMLNFSTYWDNWSGTPVVGYYSVANPYQPLLTPGCRPTSSRSGTTSCAPRNR